eukprot:tig00000865_g5101.t1
MGAATSQSEAAQNADIALSQKAKVAEEYEAALVDGDSEEVADCYRFEGGAPEAGAVNREDASSMGEPTKISYGAPGTRERVLG